MTFGLSFLIENSPGIRTTLGDSEPELMLSGEEEKVGALTEIGCLRKNKKKNTRSGCDAEGHSQLELNTSFLSQNGCCNRGRRYALG